jgi:hypothetical protein
MVVISHGTWWSHGLSGKPRRTPSGNSGQVPDEKLPMNYLQGQKMALNGPLKWQKQVTRIQATGLMMTL